MKKIKLEELKVRSFVTEIDRDKADKLKGGSESIWESVSVVVSIIESIHETGDNNSWWHCDPVTSNNSDSEVVVYTGCYIETGPVIHP